ncbi:hypothetical protein SDC9_131414 [bioreactor metagenome]|uniref:Uncharacterized protein n=1 Tax=bioreactor metagenome TaxID=1076179 RepID=A0A645D5V1_9ZZZZ
MREFIIPGGVAGYILFVYAAGAHKPPFVMIGSKPDFTYASESQILIYFFRIKMAVVINYRKLPD